MYLSKNQKILLLIGTFIPWVINGVNFYYMFNQMFTLVQEQAILIDPEDGPPSPFYFFSMYKNFYIAAIASSILSLGILVVYILHLVKDKTIKSDNRIMWILLLVLVSAIAKPIYFFMRIWRQEKPDPSAPPPIPEYARYNSHNNPNDIIIHN